LGVGKQKMRCFVSSVSVVAVAYAASVAMADVAKEAMPVVKRL
jgi:hypothetical protein